MCQILPADKKLPILSDIRLIFLHKYGNGKLNGDFKSNDGQIKLTNMKNTNSYISDILNKSVSGSIIDKRNILLKYVDIYGACMSVLKKLLEFTIDFAGPYTPDIIDYLVSIIQGVKRILTTDYFKHYLYEQTFSNLYEQMLPK